MFTISSIISIIIAFVVGYAFGSFRGRRRENPLSDPEIQKAMSKKGREAVQARIAKRKARIMERARREGKVTNDDVEDLFCISDATSRNYLNELEAEGALTQVGTTGRGVHYTPNVRGRASNISPNH